MPNDGLRIIIGTQAIWAHLKLEETRHSSLLKLKIVEIIFLKFIIISILYYHYHITIIIIITNYGVQIIYVYEYFPHYTPRP